MIKQVSLTLVAIALAFIVFSYIFGEIAVLYEIHATGAASRQELADDFGLGILGVLVVLPLSFILSCAVGLLTWRAASK